MFDGANNRHDRKLLVLHRDPVNATITLGMCSCSAVAVYKDCTSVCSPRAVVPCSGCRGSAVAHFPSP